MEKNKFIEKVSNTYEHTNEIGLIEETISNVRDILGFKKIIAFSGGGQGLKLNFNDKELGKKLSEYSTQTKYEIVEAIIKRLNDYDVAILTGGTAWDIPKIATEVARKYSIPTIGVMPERAKGNISKGKKSSSLGDKGLLNVEIVIPSVYGESQYGDESSIFAKLADGMIVIGGGAGTLIEFSHVMKINEAALKYKQNIKKIVPISGIPGVSDSLHYIPGNEEVKHITFPNKIITQPIEAFDWLRDELDLDDILKNEELIK